MAERYLKYRFRKMGVKRTIQDFSKELNKVKHILLIHPGGEWVESTLEDFFKQLQVLFSGLNISTFELKSLRKEDCNWFGLPKEAYLQYFKTEKIDMIIDLNAPQNITCAYISAISAAPIRLNFSSGPYDFIYNLHIHIDEAKSVKEKLNSIIRYLKSLKS